MDIALVTGSAGLIGAEAVRFFSARGFRVVGIDNDMRRQFFGADASTAWSRRELGPLCARGRVAQVPEIPPSCPPGRRVK